MPVRVLPAPYSFVYRSLGSPRARYRRRRRPDSAVARLQRTTTEREEPQYKKRKQSTLHCIRMHQAGIRLYRPAFLCFFPPLFFVEPTTPWTERGCELDIVRGVVVACVHRHLHRFCRVSGTTLQGEVRSGSSPALIGHLMLAKEMLKKRIMYVCKTGSASQSV